MSLLPSSVVAFIAWASANPNISATVNGISSSLPREGVTFPWLTVRRITGVPQMGEVSMDFARLQLDIWGGTKANGLPDWGAADLAARTIESEVRTFQGASVGDAYIAELDSYEGMQQLIDSETGDARFWMDVLCVVRRSDGS